MGIIDYRDGRPIYEQIAEAYKKMILKGILQQDDPMPSVRRLAMELSTNPNTIQRAYTELERQGFLYSVKGRGSFVKGGQELKEKKKEELKERLQEIFREGAEIGLTRQELLEELPEHTEE